MDIPSGLAAAGHALNIAKSIRDADKAFDQATLKAKLAEIISELADVKIAQAELVEEIQSLKAENERILKSDVEISQLTHESGYYYKMEGNGLVGWPACPSCLTLKKSVVFLIQNGKHDSAKCPGCKTEFQPVTSYITPGYSRADEQKRQRAEVTRQLNNHYSRLNNF